MDIQTALKKRIEERDFDPDAVSLNELLESDPNTRYRYTIRALSRKGYAYLFCKKKSIAYLKGYDGDRVAVMMPTREIALHCKNHDEELNKLQIKKVTKQELMFEILPLLGRRKVNVSVCTNLADVIEYPANEFRKEWFLYMFYDLKQDWMFD